MVTYLLLQRPTPLERESLPGERQPKRTPLADTGNNHISSPIRRPIKVCLDKSISLYVDCYIISSMCVVIDKLFVCII